MQATDRALDLAAGARQAGFAREARAFDVSCDAGAVVLVPDRQPSA